LTVGRVKVVPVVAACAVAVNVVDLRDGGAAESFEWA